MSLRRVYVYVIHKRPHRDESSVKIEIEQNKLFVNFLKNERELIIGCDDKEDKTEKEYGRGW